MPEDVSTANRLPAKQGTKGSSAGEERKGRRKRSAAYRSARSGAMAARSFKASRGATRSAPCLAIRTIVLFSADIGPPSGTGPDSLRNLFDQAARTDEDVLEGFPRPRLGARIAQEPLPVAVREQHAVELEGELLGVEIGAEVPLLLGDLRRPRKGLEEQPLGRHQVLPGPRIELVVELERSGDERASSGRGVAHPVHPPIDDPPD